MKENMQYVIDHAEEIAKLVKVKGQVSEVKSIMMENIDKVFSLVFYSSFRLTSVVRNFLQVVHDCGRCIDKVQ